MKDVEEDEAPDVTPVPDVMKSDAVPVGKDTLAPPEPGPEVESQPESIDAEPPVAQPVEVDTTSDPKDVEPVVGRESLPTSTLS